MSELADAVEKLQTVLARLQRIDLWPPTTAARTIADAIGTAYSIAAEPPRPAPEDIEDAAAAWRRIGASWSQAGKDVTTTRTRSAAQDVWNGQAGDDFRSSLSALSGRMASVPEATTAVDRALGDCAVAMTAARSRHDAAYQNLSRHLTISWSDLLPNELVEHLRQIIADACTTVRELQGAYQDAAAAVEAGSIAVTAAMDGIELPTHLVDGAGAVDQVNLLHGGGAGDDTGPLRGSTAARAQARLAAMSAADRAAVLALLAGAKDETDRGWILAAVASGLSGAALARYAARLGTMDPKKKSALDPSTVSGVFTQPDGTTCGSSSLVMARMLNDPAYAMYIVTGYDPRTGVEQPPPGPVSGDINTLPREADVQDLAMHNRFQQEAVKMHDQTNGLTTHDGRFNGAWPQAAGTSPGSAARQMSGGDGLSGVPGTSYDVSYVDPTNRASSYDDIVGAVDAGHAVPLYTYDIQNADGNSGAHVLLVTATEGDTLRVYDPAYGTTKVVTREEFVSASLESDLGWNRPLAAVLPS